jgi:hypothetical protein
MKLTVSAFMYYVASYMTCFAGFRIMREIELSSPGVNPTLIMNRYAYDETWIILVLLPWLVIHMGILLLQSKTFARLRWQGAAALSGAVAVVATAVMLAFNVSVLGLGAHAASRGKVQFVNYMDAVITAAVTLGALWMYRRISSDSESPQHESPVFER